MPSPPRPSLAVPRSPCLGAVCAALCVALVATAVPIGPQPQAQSKRAQQRKAKRLVRAGQADFEAGRFSEAAVKFLQAFQADPHPIIMYNVARAHEESGQLVRALEYYRTAIGLTPSETVRAELAQKVEEIELYLRAQGVDVLNLDAADWVPRGVLSIKTDPRGAFVEVNGQAVGRTPLDDRDLLQGDYTIRAEREGRATIVRKVTVVAGKTTAVKITLPPENLGPQPPPGTLEMTTPRRGLIIFVNGDPLATSPLGPTELAPGDYSVSVEGEGYPTFETTMTITSGQTTRVKAPSVAELEAARLASLNQEDALDDTTLGWIVTGVGGALVLGGAIAGSVALSDANAYEADPSAPGRAALRDSAETSALVADVLYASGAVVAGVGLTFVLLDALGEGGEEPDYGGDMVQGPGWRVAPFVSGAGAGLGAATTW